MRQRVQGAKMFEQARAGAIHFCRVDELVPGFVREKREGAELAALFEVAENFRGDAQLIFQIRGLWKLRAILHEHFLRVGALLMNLADDTDQLLPRLAMRPAVLSGINGGELPLIIAGKGFDRLR